MRWANGWKIAQQNPYAVTTFATNFIIFNSKCVGVTAKHTAHYTYGICVFVISCFFLLLFYFRLEIVIEQILSLDSIGTFRIWFTSANCIFLSRFSVSFGHFYQRVCLLRQFGALGVRRRHSTHFEISIPINLLLFISSDWGGEFKMVLSLHFISLVWEVCDFMDEIEKRTINNNL